MTTTKTLTPHQSGSVLRSQRGLSLVELMISLTISLILLAGVTSLIVQQSISRDELEKSSRQIENGRYATQIIHDDIQHAGFYGEYYSLSAPPAGNLSALAPPAAGTAFDPCSTSLANLNTAMTLPIQGYDVAPSSTAGSPIPTCLADADYKAGTDILVIRRTESMPLTGTVTTLNKVLAQTTAASGVLGVVGSMGISTSSPPAPFTLTGKLPANPAPIRGFSVHIYFISPCSVPAGGGTTCTGSADDNGKPIPTLKMLDITAGGAATTPIPLVEGIENMQFDFGQDTDGDGAPDVYASPDTTTKWSNVMTVRVNLLARNNECTTGYTDNKSYDLGSATSVAVPASNCINGGYKRHVYTELVRAVNPSGRREQ